MLHAAGTITIRYQQTSSGTWNIKINLLPNTPGTFKWKDKIYP